MYKFGKYKPTDNMSELISEHYRILLVMSRFGISLGFGDKDIGEVCKENDVDTETFLAVVNLLLSGDTDYSAVVPKISVETLITYLHNSHDYFLEFRLPGIREKLVEVIVPPGDDLSKAIIGYFDEYVAEVRRHMEYEEKTVFPYVRDLVSGKPGKEGYNIHVFEKQHDQVEARLTEFKHILIKYYPAKSTNQINSVLFDIFNCENDLASHNAIEDHLFVPAIVAMEEQSKKGGNR